MHTSDAHATSSPTGGTLELLAWLSTCRRTYRETMDVWGTHCPRHSDWEDALAGGLVRVLRSSDGSEAQVTLTSAGAAVLKPSAADRD